MVFSRVTLSFRRQGVIGAEIGVLSVLRMWSSKKQFAFPDRVVLSVKTMIRDVSERHFCSDKIDSNSDSTGAVYVSNPAKTLLSEVAFKPAFQGVLDEAIGLFLQRQIMKPTVVFRMSAVK